MSEKIQININTLSEAPKPLPFGGAGPGKPALGANGKYFTVNGNQAHTYKVTGARAGFCFHFVG